MGVIEDSILHVSNYHHNKIKRFCAPLKEHFDINHFWYYKITNDGYFTFLGSHAHWNECQFSLKTHLVNPYIRHPSVLVNGVSFMADVEDPDFQHQLVLARQKYNVNFNLNFSYDIEDGVEGFGFATPYSTNQIKCKLFNELPLLRLFVNKVKEQNPAIFNQLDEHCVDIGREIGPQFYQSKGTTTYNIPNKKSFLNHIGVRQASLSTQEKRVFYRIIEGYNTREIAEEMNLSKRTIEHYLESIKNKLNCFSKNEIIKRANELALVVG